MNGGDTAPEPQRGRSTSPKKSGGSKKTDKRKSASGTGQRSNSRNGKEGATTKQGSTKSKRSISKDRKSCSTKEEKSDRAKEKSRKPKTPARNTIDNGEESPIKSRAIKQEMIENIKVQQTLVFPSINNTVDLTATEEDTTARREDGKGTTQNPHAKVVVTPGHRIKRKQGEITQERQKVQSSVVKRNTPNNRSAGNRPTSAGRGREIHRVENILMAQEAIRGPPENKNTAEAGKGFEPQKEETALIEQMQKSILSDTRNTTVEEIENNEEVTERRKSKERRAETGHHTTGQNLDMDQEGEFHTP